MKSPAGTFTTTFSPFFLPSRARPTGLSFEIRPSDGLASAEPTIVNASVPSGLSTLTVEPIWTWSVEWCSSMMIAFLISASSVWIRPSTNACSFLASSYSAFSDRSPCSLASWIRFATSGRSDRDHLVELGAELLEAVLGEIGGLVVHVRAPAMRLVGCG